MCVVFKFIFFINLLFIVLNIVFFILEIFLVIWLVYLENIVFLVFINIDFLVFLLINFILNFLLVFDMFLKDIKWEFFNLFCCFKLYSVLEIDFISLNLFFI